jgi:hypothetical protein
MTFNEFTRALVPVLAAFPKLEPSEKTIETWYILLQDLDAGRFQIACVAFCRSQKEIYPGTNIVACLRDMTDPDTAPSAIEAWGEVREKLSCWREGDLVPQFTNQRVDAVVEAMGFYNMAMSSNPNRERDRFIRAYESASERDEHLRLTGDMPMQLEGGERAPTDKAWDEARKVFNGRDNE